jgi:hypothetical protein
MVGGWLLVIGYWLLVVRHSSFVIRHSSFAIRHSSFVIRHSSFVIRHSSAVPDNQYLPHPLSHLTSDSTTEVPPMSVVRRSVVLLALVAAALSLASCDQTPVGPGTGSGNTLKATINGVPYTFELREQRYDQGIHYAFVFGGSGSGAAGRTLTVTFVSDITTGTFPRTVTSDDVSIIYIEDPTGQQITYDNVPHRGQTSMTLSSNTGGIVDGTFSGTLANRANAAQTITISGGQFSVELQ